MPIIKLDRYKGALVGVLAGDALGAPYETWTKDRIATDMAERGGLVPFDYVNPWSDTFPNMVGKGIMPAGRPTDDADHTAALATSLVLSRGLNEQDLFKRLREVVHGGISPLWEGRAVGAGQTTRKALRPETLEESYAIDTSNAYPSNGSLMRCSPLALLFGSPETVDVSIVHRMSLVTHRHPVSINMCEVYIKILTAILVDDSHLPLVYTSAVDRASPEDPLKWPERGNVQLSFEVAMWAFANAKDFRDGLTKAISVGGDTDTYGAIAGGLLGAKFGIEGIPQEWRDVLKGADIMEGLAGQLYTLAHH